MSKKEVERRCEGREDGGDGCGGAIMKRERGREMGERVAREETCVPASHMQIEAEAALRLRGCDDKTVAHSEAWFDLESLKIERPPSTAWHRGVARLFQTRQK